MRLTPIAAALAVCAAALTAVPAHAGRPAPVIADISTIAMQQFTPSDVAPLNAGPAVVAFANLATDNVATVAATHTYTLSYRPVGSGAPFALVPTSVFATPTFTLARGGTTTPVDLPSGFEYQLRKLNSALTAEWSS